MEFEYLEEAGKKFLVYNKMEDQDIDYVTLGMMENNEIAGTLPFYYRQIDQEVEFRYDVTGLKSINELFGGKMNRVKVVRLLKAIAEICENCEKYMVDITQIVVKPEYIFVDNNGTKVEFVLMPLVNANVKFDEQLKNVILSLDFDRTENCSYVAELLNYFQHHTAFSHVEFANMIQTIENGIGNRPPIRDEIKHPHIPTPVVPNPAPPKQVIPPVQTPPVYIDPINGHGIVPVNPPEGAEIDDAQKKKGLFGFGKKNENVVKEPKNPKRTKIQGFGNIAIPGEMDGGYSDGTIKIPNEPQTIKAQDVQITTYRPGQSDFGETTVLSKEPDTTSVQYGEVGPRMYELVRTSTGDRYQIVKPLTKIGRKESLVDICITGNIYVGRIHAVIHLRNGELFIEDNGSVNGTFINGSPNKITEMVKIQPGDRIILGDEELTVI